MSEAEFIFRSMNTHHVFIVDTWDDGSSVVVARAPFSSISLTDYRDTKASIFRSEVIGITVTHDCCR